MGYNLVVKVNVSDPDPPQDPDPLAMKLIEMNIRIATTTFHTLSLFQIFCLLEVNVNFSLWKIKTFSEMTKHGS